MEELANKVLRLTLKRAAQNLTMNLRPSFRAGKNNHWAAPENGAVFI